MYLCGLNFEVFYELSTDFSLLFFLIHYVGNKRKITHWHNDMGGHNVLLLYDS